MWEKTNKHPNFIFLQFQAEYILTWCLRKCCFSILTVLCLSEPYRKQHHPSLSVLILFSPHLPIGMLVFGFTTFMFSDLCTHRPSPGYALWHSPAKAHKTNLDITRSQRIKMPLLRDISPAPSFHSYSHLF